jgi:hypothetical protein
MPTSPTLLPVARAGVALLALLATQPTAAQGWLGLAQSNYAGTHATYINPSAIADSRHRAYLNLGAASANFHNTYLQLDLPQRPWAKGFTFQRDYLREQLTGNAHAVSASAEARLPSLMLTVGPRSAIALTNRVRAFAQVRNVSENLTRLARYGLGDADSLGLANRLLTDNTFDTDANSYHEFAFTYARTFTPNTTHFLKGGLTIKYLVGLGGGYVHNAGTDLQVYSSDSIQLRTPHVSYGYTDKDYYEQRGFGVGTLYGGQGLGSGYGADLGFTYEWRPEHERYDYVMDGTNLPDDTRNKYRLRVGLALTDLGAVRYRHAQHVQQATLADSRTVQLGQLDTISFSGGATLTSTVERLVGLREQSRQFTSYLPATLRLTADYRLLEHVYAGLLWTQNLLPARTIGSRSSSSVALTPRLEFSRFEVAVPVVLANNYRQLQVGTMLRVGPLIVGSDNLGGLVGLTSTSGADVYFGLSLALHRHRRKDRDGDLVSNKYDKCLKEKGTWASKGCPAPSPAPLPELPMPAAPAEPVPAPPADPAPVPATP